MEARSSWRPGTFTSTDAVYTATWQKASLAASLWWVELSLS
jgi:hypothetical protein